MEMKRCKECGKLFTPKSARTQYCDDIHYRPCPVCGKLVEAKYLSDPARCCSKECQQALRNKGHKSSVSTPNNSKPAVAAKQIVAALGEPQLAISVKRTDRDLAEWISTMDEYDAEETLRAYAICASYIRIPVFGFVVGHEYAIEIHKEKDSVYEIHAIYDFTDHKPVDLWTGLASWISVNQNFTTATVRMSADNKLEEIGDGPIYSVE